MVRTRRRRIITSALGVLMFVPALFRLGCAWSLAAAISFMILFGIGWGFFDINHMLILCQIVRPAHRATGYSFMNWVSISVGVAAKASLGWMRDHGFKFVPAFTVSVVLALISAGLILFLKPRTDLNESN